MSSNYPELVFKDDEDFTADRLNKAMQVLDQRLRSLEPFAPQWESAVNELRLFGLTRLNEAIQPAYDRVMQLADFGFLVAESNTSVTLVQDQDVTFVINEGAQRDLFTPTPFLVITRSDVATDYATSRLKTYDKITGELVVTIQTITGNAGPFSDWWIGPLAGNTLSSIDYLTQIKAAKDAAVAAKTAAAASATQTAADRVQTTADAATSTSKANAASTSAANAAASAAAAAASALSVDANNLLTKDKNLEGLADLAVSRVNLDIEAYGPSGKAVANGFDINTLPEKNGAYTTPGFTNAPDANGAVVFQTVFAAGYVRQEFHAFATGLTYERYKSAGTWGSWKPILKGTGASAADILSNTGSGVITVDNAWTAAQELHLTGLTGNVALDASQASNFYLSLTGNVTILTPSNLKRGQVINFAFVQPAGGGKTISWSGSFVFPNGLAPTITTASGAYALIGSIWYDGNSCHVSAWRVS